MTLWLSRSAALAVDVALARVARVVAVALEEPDHLVLGVEQVRAAVVLRDGPVERAVVGDRERAPCTRPGCPAGTARCTSTGCCRRTCCRPATSSRRSAPACPSAPRRRGRRTGSGSRRRCRRGSAGRCRRRRPRWPGPSTTPTRPSCRSRSGPSPNRSGRRAGSAAGSPSGGRWPAAGARRCPGSSPAGRCRCGTPRRST